jgi:type IV pilus assembly protein PilB
VTENHSKKHVGELLVEAGLVSPRLVDYAVAVAKTTGARLGETLEKLGLVTDHEIARAIANQSGCAFVELEREPSDPAALRLLPLNFAQKHMVLPLRVEEGRLHLACEDPLNPQLPGLIARFVAQPLQLAIAPKIALGREIQRRYYRAEHSLDDEVSRIAQAAAAGRDFSADRLAELIISAAIEAAASDVHVSPTPLASIVSLRVDGVLQTRFTLPIAAHPRLVSAVKVMAALDIADSNRAQDGRISFQYLEERHDLRVATMPNVNGENLVIRLLAAGGGNLWSLRHLGYTDTQIAQIERLTNRAHGAVLVTGPTGSGKTTTLYAMLRRIDMLSRNVLTVEDPVEIRLPLARQMEVNERAGIHFASALRAFLRQDPDVILVGEVRDAETAQLTLRAAQTGHTVLTTVHTNDAIGAIVRLRDLGCQDAVIASALNGIIAQRLVRRLCLHCRERVAVPPELGRRFPQVEHVYQHRGCAHCHHTGYAGRLAVAEIIELDNPLRSLIEQGAMPTQIEEVVRAGGVPSLQDAGLMLVAHGITDLAEVKRVI